MARGSEIAEALHECLAAEAEAWLDETATGRASSWVTAWLSGVWERMRDSLEAAAARRADGASALVGAVVCQLEPEDELPLGARVALSADPISWCVDSAVPFVLASADSLRRIVNAAQTLFVRQLVSEADSGDDDRYADSATTCSAVWSAVQVLGGACMLWTEAVQPIQWRQRKRRAGKAVSDLHALRSARLAVHRKAAELRYVGMCVCVCTAVRSLRWRRASADATLKRVAPAPSGALAFGRHDRVADATAASGAKRHASASAHGYTPLLADVRRAVGVALALVGDERAGSGAADR